MYPLSLEYYNRLRLVRRHRKKERGDYLLKYAGISIPIVVFVLSRKSILWDIALMKCSMDVLIGTITKASKVDDNLYLGVVPLIEDGDAMMICKKFGINAVVSVLEPHEQVGTSLVGTPLGKREWNHIGIEDRDRLILEECKEGDPFSLTLHDLHRVADYLNYYLSNNKKVFIHCRNGRGHGASLVMAYIIKYKRIGLKEAYMELKKARGRIDFELQSPQTALLSKFMATSWDGDKARGSGVQLSASRRDKII